MEGNSGQSEQSEQFDAVNDKYWRSRSDSASSANSEARARKQSRTQENLEEGEIVFKSESDDSDSLDSEADDSILLNIGSKENGMDDGEDYDPERLMPENGIQNGTTAASTSNGVEIKSGSQSKEEAFRLFALKYPTTPTSLVDLNKKDLETQSRYVYYDRNIHDLDLKLPISCIECQAEGHMADICPTKEVCSMRFASRDITFHTDSCFSAHTAVLGTSTQALSVPPGEDAKNVANEATASHSAHPSYEAPPPRCLATCAATNTSNQNATSSGNSHPETCIPTKSPSQSPAPTAPAQST
jgi:hypothetical protein